MTTPQPDFVDTITIGAARVTAITHGVLYWAPEMMVPESEWRTAIPEADAAGMIPCALISVVVQVGDATILIDPGPDEPGTAWSARFTEEWPGSTRTPGLAAGLRAAGISEDQVSSVVITHAHFDHFAAVTWEEDGEQVPRFPNAEIVLQRAEWDGNPERENPESDVAQRLGSIERAGRLRLVDGETDLMPGVRLVPAPGETEGHMVVNLRSGDGSLWVLGDLMHHACEVSHIEWTPSQRDAAAMQRSRQHVFAEAADSDAIVVFTHERFPPWGKIVRSGDGYRWTRLEPTSSSPL